MNRLILLPFLLACGCSGQAFGTNNFATIETADAQSPLSDSGAGGAVGIGGHPAGSGGAGGAETIRATGGAASGGATAGGSGGSVAVGGMVGAGGVLASGGAPSAAGGAPSGGVTSTGGAVVDGSTGGTTNGGCPTSMMQGAGAFCIDKQPALLVIGDQGPEVSWSDANAVCAGRGARLCTQEERESSCPGGQDSSKPENHLFCSGPASTWEWSATACNGSGHCRTPCCNSVQYPCDTNACDATPSKSSYHCCK